MNEPRSRKPSARRALGVAALAAAGLLAGCATPLPQMPHDAQGDADPIAELRRLGEAVATSSRKMVPRSACRNLPCLSCTAPVKLPST